ncbi:TPA: hypothetical protein POH82_001545 [Staphylococcus aureus]|nr:hypothetical protein [Staphylococcus aureus]
MPHHSTTSSRIVAPAHQSNKPVYNTITAQRHIIALYQVASWYQHIKVAWHQHQAPTTAHQSNKA